jgi:hypothetical protein
MIALTVSRMTCQAGKEPQRFHESWCMLDAPHAKLISRMTCRARRDTLVLVLEYRGS